MASPALTHALARVGDRWSLLLVEALMDRPLRFAALQDAVPGISTNILTARLRHLEASGLVLAVPYSERPRRFAYELTAAGRDLGGVVRMLTQWATDHAGTGPGGPGAAPVHAACGTVLEPVWWCPTCEQPDPGGEPAEVWV
jgi:DNA-binding HxlR family transcriptional regulator